MSWTTKVVAAVHTIWPQVLPTTLLGNGASCTDWREQRGWRWPLDTRSGSVSAGDQPGRRMTVADPQDSSDGCTNGRQHHHTAASKQGGDAASGPSTIHHP